MVRAIAQRPVQALPTARVSTRWTQLVRLTTLIAFTVEFARLEERTLGPIEETMTDRGRNGNRPLRSELVKTEHLALPEPLSSVFGAFSKSGNFRPAGSFISAS